jgi:hypothetical protein
LRTPFQGAGGADEASKKGVEDWRCSAIVDHEVATADVDQPPATLSVRVVHSWQRPT